MYAKPMISGMIADVETASCTPVPPPACEQDGGGWVRLSDDFYVGWRHSYIKEAGDTCLENPFDTEPTHYFLLTTNIHFEHPTLDRLAHLALDPLLGAQGCIRNHYIAEPGLGITECAGLP